MIDVTKFISKGENIAGAARIAIIEASYKKERVCFIF